MSIERLPLISVILPIYNVSKYLERCLDSILQQDYVNLDVIMIDDGSTDSSLQICEDYAKKDNRFRVIHQSNGGISKARNRGLELIKGDYFSFVDPDDYVEPEYISYLYGLCCRYHTDMSLCSHTVLFENGRKDIKGNGKEELLNAKECIQEMLYFDMIDTSCWGKLYHRELIGEICFPENTLFEDTACTYKFFLKAKQIACGYQNKYVYCIREESITTDHFNPAKLDLIKVTDQMAADVVSIYPELRDAAMFKCIRSRFSTLNQLENVSDYEEIRKEIIDYIKGNRSVLLKDPKARKTDKIAAILLGISYPLYVKIWGMIKRRRIE